MKNWERYHPRRSIGVQVHEVLEEKKRRWAAEDSFKMEMEVEEESSTPLEETTSPSSKHPLNLRPDLFVETEEVKRIKDRVELWLQVGYPVHIIGPTGCGKTTIALKVAEELGRPVVWISGDAEMTTTSLVGGYTGYKTESVRDQFIHRVIKSRDVVKGGWADNPLTLACKNGYTLIYNDFSRAKPEANNILLTTLQEKVLELPTRVGDERYVKVSPEFRVIFTSNPIDYAGTYTPQNALLDRMATVFMDYYSLETELEIVKTFTELPLDEASYIVDVIRALREKLPISEKPGTRACIMAAKALTRMGLSEENLEKVCLDLLSSKIKETGDLETKKNLVREVIATQHNRMGYKLVAD